MLPVGYITVAFAKPLEEIEYPFQKCVVLLLWLKCMRGICSSHLLIMLIQERVCKQTCFNFQSEKKTATIYPNLIRSAGSGFCHFLAIRG